jgi:glycosyltransferase involved in cell wall biosynthesis
MPHIIQAVPDVRMIILGEGPERAALEALRGQLGLADRIILPGQIAWSNVPEYLAMASVFVMPSVLDVKGNLDGLPNVVLEAMAAGCPVVATHIAGIPLAVSDGETGVLVDEAEPERLGAAILAILQSPEAGPAMGAAGRRRIETELNWHTLARRFDELYQLRQ